jgi:hypothetical protein
MDGADAARAHGVARTDRAGAVSMDGADAAGAGKRYR